MHGSLLYNRAAFESWMGDDDARRPKVDFTVTVLTTGFWPTYAPVPLTMPPSLAHALRRFEDFYLAKHQGRKLKWQHTHSHCMVRARFAKGTRKELQVSLLQTVVLLLFNGAAGGAAAGIGFRDVLASTGMEDGELRRTLQSLACGRVRVLNKVPKGRDVLDDDRFVFNADFTHKQRVVKINSIQMKETAAEQKDTQEKVFRDRQYVVDANIVRIMKSRKVLTHPLLIAELFEQLKFNCKVRLAAAVPPLDVAALTPPHHAVCRRLPPPCRRLPPPFRRAT